MNKHFLTLLDYTADELKIVIEYAILLKNTHKQGKAYRPFVGKTLAMIFKKASTRTRVSFETGMHQLGGHAIFLSEHDSQLGRNESLADTAKVLSAMVDIISVRTFKHEQLEEFAAVSAVPVINALTDSFHPCQLLADIQTFTEQRGSIRGAIIAWIGDGNNMCHSYINAAKQFGFTLQIACPDNYMPDQALVTANQQHIVISDSPQEAVANANLVVTDTWASMGQEEEQQRRLKAFADYQVNESLLDNADKDVLFTHCLPAHEGEEISHGLLDDRRSVVWQAAENRLHAQKALLVLMLEGRATLATALKTGNI